MRIVFMGNPEFAVPSLKRLNENFSVVGVVTGQDKLGGRGKKQLLESAVKIAASSLNLEIEQPEKLKSPDFLAKLNKWAPDLQVVVAFKMLPEVVWSLPPLGTINLHTSLLPAYRGAAPINWVIIRGEPMTGVTCFFLDKKIDTGVIITQEKTHIGPDETAGELHDRLKVLGAELLVKTVKAIQANAVERTPQNEEQVSQAPKIFFDDCELNFRQDSLRVHNWVRGLNPYPSAWTKFEGKVLKIHQGLPFSFKHLIEPGELVSDRKNFLAYTTTNGYYQVKTLQLEGKKRMDVRTFLNGLQISQSHIQCDDFFNVIK